MKAELNAIKQPVYKRFFVNHVDLMKKKFVGLGLHLRPVRADRARSPLQWTLNYLLSACGSDNGRRRPPPDRGTLKTTSILLVT